MIYVFLAVVGLAAGSFVNALVWRIYQQSKSKKPTKKVGGKTVDLSITKGRSVCTHCGHVLAPKDLVPVLSWVSLGGKCRYCKKPIDDSPIIEVASMITFLISYHWWPYELAGAASWAVFVMWLIMLVGLIALTVYDIRHMLLPNRIVFPLIGLAVLIRLALYDLLALDFREEFIDGLLGMAIGGGLFYLVYIVSRGRWIGGGDVKLGFLLGIALGPLQAAAALMVAFYSATFVVLPLMMLKKVSRKSRVPFGPFLILGFFVAMLFGEDIISWYERIVGLS